MLGSFTSGMKLLVLASLCLPLTSGCVKKGEGKGTRAVRPDANGSIFDDGDKNQKPKETEDKEGPEKEQMNPEARAILAACFNVDVSEVENIVGWTNPTSAVAAAKALCAKLDKTGFKSGIAQTAEPVEID